MLDARITHSSHRDELKQWQEWACFFVFLGSGIPPSPYTPGRVFVLEEILKKIYTLWQIEKYTLDARSKGHSHVCLEPPHRHSRDSWMIFDASLSPRCHSAARVARVTGRTQPFLGQRVSWKKKSQISQSC